MIIPTIDQFLTHTASSIQLVSGYSSAGEPIYGTSVVNVPCFMQSYSRIIQQRNGEWVRLHALFFFSPEAGITDLAKITFNGKVFTAVDEITQIMGEKGSVHHLEVLCI